MFFLHCTVFLLLYYFIALPKLYACSIALLFFMSPIADAFVPKIIPPSMLFGTQQVNPLRDATIVSVKDSSGAAQVIMK